MISKLVAKATVTCLAASFVLTAAPALAAAAPTLSDPADRTGFGLITLTGTASPGAAVHLYETAIVFDDLEPAEDWENGGGVVTATADSSGHFSIHRYLDSGFYFQVESGGARSNKITVNIRVLPTLTLSASGGTVQAHVAADPAQPGLPAQLQRYTNAGWTTVASGHTGSDAAFDATNALQYGGTYTYRAYIGADPANGVLANYSSQQTVSVEGSANPDPEPVPAPSPSPSPAVGSVQFTRIQYNSPGTDTGSNTSLNNEWFRLTNKTRSTINLKGWTVRDASSHVYTFTATTTLAAGKSLTVYTGKGTNGTASRYWARTYYIWNNTGDTAILRTGAGKTIDTCKWGNGTGATNC
jgi:hypothetical protein